VQFIDDVVPQGQTVPVLIFPGKIWIYYLGGTVDPLRLKQRSRIWSFLFAVKAVKIESAWLHLPNYTMVIALLVPLQLHKRLSRSDNSHLHLVQKGCPHGKATSPSTQVNSTQFSLTVQDLSSPLSTTKITEKVDFYGFYDFNDFNGFFCALGVLGGNDIDALLIGF
jgi:hypothetical protein